MELQYCSSISTPSNALIWIDAGIKISILRGGVCANKSGVQASFPDTKSWAEYAMSKGSGACSVGARTTITACMAPKEDVDPNFAGAKTIDDTVNTRRGFHTQS